MPVIFTGCSRETEADTKTPSPVEIPTPPSKPPPAPPHGESCLGVRDTGIWGDLDAALQLALPPTSPTHVTARIDAQRDLLVLSIDHFPRKVYPLGGSATLRVGTRELAVRPGDRAELATLLTADHITEGATPRTLDHDRDGIPDPLDVLIGAKKTVLNGAAYTEGWTSIRKYPGGDVPRTEGVCTDVVVRAVRNAGVDLQQALHEDISRARRAYPMVKGRGNPQIDQRRVATLLPYFRRHWQRHSAKLDDPADPLRPGDVIFMDTFPRRSGPDHIGILSDTVGESGLPLVINNWTNGMVTQEMDLLTFVPVLYRFRLSTP